MKINLASLDALRGLLAMYVMLGHCRWLLWTGLADWLSQPHPGWEKLLAYASGVLRYGHEAVMVFFVLSGFFIHLRAASGASSGRTAVAAGPFYRRRLHRLLAPYLLALAVTVACDAVGRTWFPALHLSATDSPLLNEIFLNKGYSVGSVLPALVLLPSSLGRDFGSNGPLWSIAYEVVYYALYPAWVALRHRSAWVAFGLVPVFCLLLAFLPWRGFPVMVLIHYPIWLAGAALAEHMAKWSAPRGSLWPAALTFVAALGLFRGWHHAGVSAVAGAALGGAAVWWFASLPGSFCGTALGRGLEYLGLRSYTIYMTHFPVLALLAAAVIQTSGRRPGHGWWALAGALLATLASLVCFHFCERHFLHPRLRLTPGAHDPERTG